MKPKIRARPLLLLLVAVTTLPSLGCLAAGLAVAGACAAGGAAGYAVYKGRLARDYPAGFPETAQATQASLAELGFPVLERSGDIGNLTLVSETTNGTKITVDLTAQTSPIPSDGPITRVGIRVGVFGDEYVATSILDEVGVRLVPAARGPRPGSAPGALQPVAAPLPLGPTPQASPIPVVETASPPLAQPGRAEWRGKGP